MSEIIDCPECAAYARRIEEMEMDLADLEDRQRLLNIAEEYADLLAEQGKIPNTPAGKKGYIRGEIVAR